MKAVLIRWEDHFTTDSGWVDIKDTADYKPAVVESLGWLLHETDEFYVVALHLDTTNTHVNQSALILKSTVKEVIHVEDIRSIGSSRASGPTKESSRSSRRLKS